MAEEAQGPPRRRFAPLPSPAEKAPSSANSICGHAYAGGANFVSTTVYGHPAVPVALHVISRSTLLPVSAIRVVAASRPSTALGKNSEEFAPQPSAHACDPLPTSVVTAPAKLTARIKEGT